MKIKLVYDAIWIDKIDKIDSTRFSNLSICSVKLKKGKRLPQKLAYYLACNCFLSACQSCNQILLLGNSWGQFQLIKPMLKLFK